MLSAPPSRFAPGLLRHNRRKVTNLGALSAIFLLKNRRKAEFCHRRRDTTTENGRLSAQKRAAFYKTFFICSEKFFPKSVIFFIIYAEKFVTNLLTHITNFVTRITKFVTSVTSFVTKTFKEEGKNFSKRIKTICTFRKKKQGDNVDCQRTWLPRPRSRLFCIATMKIVADMTKKN